MACEQRIVRFSGTVQGVGFRYTACRVAARHDVGGYVQNLSNGQVECIVEGEAAEIEAFLDEIGRAMSGYIRDQTQQKAPYGGTYGSFGVRY